MEEREERKRMQELREQERRHEEEKERLMEQKQVTLFSFTGCFLIYQAAGRNANSAQCLFRKRRSNEPKRSRRNVRRTSTNDSRPRSS